jgi:hypothetical protein
LLRSASNGIGLLDMWVKWAVRPLMGECLLVGDQIEANRLDMRRGRDEIDLHYR